jgi:hypothetical protein
MPLKNWRKVNSCRTGMSSILKMSGFCHFYLRGIDSHLLTKEDIYNDAPGSNIDEDPGRIQKC